MQALFGEFAGNGTGSALVNNNFLITPFIGKLIVFIDEVRIEGQAGINEVKKIVRQTQISGQVKFGHQRDYYIPARLILAANQTDIGLKPEDAVDRALFFITAWTAQNKGMTDMEFLEWTVGLKPFYQRFVEMLESVDAKQHLMRYFRDYPCSREGLEDLTHSSRNDENVVKSTMSKAREVARQIVASARILPANDITAWFNLYHLRAAILREDGTRSRVEASSVMVEYERAGVIEPARAGGGGYFKFKWGYGKLLQKLSEAHNLKLEPQWDTGPGDFDDNPVRSMSARRHGAAIRRRMTAVIVLSSLASATILITSTPSEAHCFSRWHYPWPQRCWIKNFPVTLERAGIARPRRLVNVRRSAPCFYRLPGRRRAA